MTVRTAELGDIPAIRAIAHAGWPVAYATILSKEQLAYMLDRMYDESVLVEQLRHKGHRFLLAEEGGIAIGFATVEHRYKGSGRSRLHKLYVLPGVKGSGVGHALLEAVLDESRTKSAEAIELNVNKYNPAKQWYERQGFRTVREEVIPIGQGYVMDDFVMELMF
jgi:ribosomal protein S18 acetylase RimI-like enzyme